MREKMKKMLFLMLFLLILGAASVSAQVRIGGNGVPNGAAVLDLNATDAINNGTKTLALPRVSLASTTDNLGSATLLNGMLVYNTNATSGAGVYYWDTNKWVKVSDGTFIEADGVVGNEIRDTIAGGGLTRSGSGTAENPYKVGIKPNGIVNSMIADRAMSLSKISTNATDSGLFLMSDGTGAVAVGMKNFDFYDALNLRVRPPRNVVWNNVLDTTVNVTFKRNTLTYVGVSENMNTALCTGGHHAGLVTILPAGRNLAMISAHNEQGVVALRVMCYRPSF
ncbi:hypothetical protein FACS189451_08740 [Bacteroidia bacterium]|nr:hypothetical protein FACS189451_08740 [Bacteroidia bacterium]